MDKSKKITKLPKVLRDVSFRPDQSREDGKVPVSIKYMIHATGDRLVSEFGTFDHNNGMLAYVDGMGDTYCVPIRFSPSDVENGMTQELSYRVSDLYGENGNNITEMLRDSGYQRGSFGVPHSNDGGEWGSKIFKDARIIERIERQLEMEKVYSRLGVEPQLDVPEELADRFKPAWESFDNFGSLVKDIGRFHSNNGTLAFVDKYAISHVAPAKRELFEGLEKAGFEGRYIGVPHSNDCGKWLHEMFPKAQFHY